MSSLNIITLKLMLFKAMVLEKKMITMKIVDISLNSN